MSDDGVQAPMVAYVCQGRALLRMSIAKKLFEDAIGMLIPVVLYIDYGKRFGKENGVVQQGQLGGGPARAVLFTSSILQVD